MTENLVTMDCFRKNGESCTVARTALFSAQFRLCELDQSSNEQAVRSSVRIFGCPNENIGEKTHFA